MEAGRLTSVVGSSVASFETKRHTIGLFLRSKFP
jgi:hypothetical protein